MYKLSSRRPVNCRWRKELMASKFAVFSAKWSCARVSRWAGRPRRVLTPPQSEIQGAYAGDGGLEVAPDADHRLPKGVRQPPLAAFNLRPNVSIEDVSTYENSSNIASCTTLPSSPLRNQLFFSLFISSSGAPLLYASSTTSNASKPATQLFVRRYQQWRPSPLCLSLLLLLPRLRPWPSTLRKLEAFLDTKEWRLTMSKILFSSSIVQCGT